MRHMLSYILIVLWIYSCNQPTSFAPIYGCTDSQACNFSPDANVFDNSCDYNDFDADGICDVNDECVVLNLEPECYYSSYVEGMILEDGMISEEGELINFGNLLPQFEFEEEEIIEEPEPIEGCTDNHCSNYSSDAEIDDGSCQDCIVCEDLNEAECENYEFCTFDVECLEIIEIIIGDGEFEIIEIIVTPDEDFEIIIDNDVSIFPGLNFCPADYFSCDSEADSNNLVITPFGIPNDSNLKIYIQDDCSNMIDIIHDGYLASGYYDISYQNENLETGIYQKVFEVDGQILTRNFYFCNY
tara:strand:- start:26 stop:925 length:900 start_codon:yes stop_codon:yes gene_type:complete